jgi:T-complex protein 1 subunit epsilon
MEGTSADERVNLDMKEQFVYDPLISKRQQYLLATQLVRAVLKIGEFVSTPQL